MNDVACCERGFFESECDGGCGKEKTDACHRRLMQISGELDSVEEKKSDGK